MYRYNLDFRHYDNGVRTLDSNVAYQLNKFKFKNGYKKYSQFACVAMQ